MYFCSFFNSKSTTSQSNDLSISVRKVPSWSFDFSKSRRRASALFSLSSLSSFGAYSGRSVCELSQRERESAFHKKLATSSSVSLLRHFLLNLPCNTVIAPHKKKRKEKLARNSASFIHGYISPMNYSMAKCERYP